MYVLYTHSLTALPPIQSILTVLIGFEKRRRGREEACCQKSRTRGKVSQYMKALLNLRFLTRAGETRFPILAWGILRMLGHFVNIVGLMLTLTLK